jgi:hypothetical protein
MDEPGKMYQLRAIMTLVHELAGLAWPDITPADALGVIVDIQAQVCVALDLPDDLDLTDGTI